MIFHEPMSSVDFGDLAMQMTELIQNNVVEEDRLDFAIIHHRYRVRHYGGSYPNGGKPA